MNKTVVPPFAIIWFCDAKNVSHILPDYSNEVQMGLCELHVLHVLQYTHAHISAHGWRIALLSNSATRQILTSRRFAS
jgi:hypothetical protein